MELLKYVLIWVGLITLQGRLSVNGQEEGPILTIPQGTLLGSFGTSREGRQYKSFKAVPYGQVPRRFDEAVFAAGWDGVYNATVSSSGCLTTDLYSPTPAISGREDCLDLDLYTPLLPDDSEFEEPMPVMIFVPGGGFIWSSSYMADGQYFMDQNVIIVLPNFRFGAFGLLQADIDGARGNQALKDIVLSIKWVKENIQMFGGDPSKITIYGESSGAGAVSLLTLSPMTQGLISGAIIQSGMATCPGMFHASPGLKYAQRLASLLDCPTRNTTNMVECLRNVPSEEIALKTKFAMDNFGFRRDGNEGLDFSVTVETFSKGPNDPYVFLSKTPKEILEGGEFTKVPMIIGQIGSETGNTMQYSVNDSAIVADLNREFGRRFPEYLYYDVAVDDPCVITGILKDRYFGGQEISVDTVDGLTALYDERLFSQCIRKAANEYAKLNTVYMYNFTKQRTGSEFPPAHSEDLVYLFSFPPSPGLGINDPDYQFSKDMVSLWVSFARNGKPETLSNGIEWIPLTSGDPTTHTWLQFNENPAHQLTDSSYADSWKFWDSLQFKGSGEF